MEKIRDEQDLLERYWRAGLSIIWEYSDSIEKDSKELEERIKEYAERRDLKVGLER